MKENIVQGVIELKQKSAGAFSKADKLAFAASLRSFLASSASSLILPLPPCCLLLLLSSLSSPPISLLPPPSPLGSTTSSTSTLLLARYDRVVLGRVVVDEALRLLRERVRLVLVRDL